ncbi:MAG: hypothetical protein K0U38_10910, partial [Epsilonproteobacteria bacterium]|nr:hypothetical protein [Campylobacterota bacterium]
IKLFSIIFFFIVPVFAGNISSSEPTYNQVYRTDRVADSYHFLLLTKDGTFYHLHTNKTNILTASEIKSPNIVNILNKKQSWGQAFPLSGKFTKKNGKLYTKRYWDQIKVTSSKKIKYLNKTFHIQ